MTIHKPQMSTETTRGERFLLGAEGSRHTYAAHKFQPTSEVQSTVGRTRFPASGSPTGPCTGGGCQASPVLFIPIARNRSSRLLEHRRGVGAHPLSYRLLATSIRRCRLARGPQFCLSKHSTRQCSNASEGHRSTSLVGVTFQRSERDTDQRTKSWKLQPTRTAP